MTAALSADLLETLDRHVEAFADRHGLTGLAYGVVEHGALVHGAGFGVASHGGPAVGIDTVFRIASMTKSFTAAAVLLLRDEGRLALDDPIARHAPELAAIRPPTADSPAVTIRHLLTMSSGLSTDDPWADRHLDASPAEMDAIFATGAGFAVAPGTALEYSNLGYAMLGRIVERVTGGSVAQFVTDRLLAPLGMSHTSFALAALPAGAALAVGYRNDGGVEEPLADGGFGPMGGLWSTVADLARWVGFFCDAFPARDDADDAPLRRASRREMQQVHQARRPTLGFTGLDGFLRLGAGGYGMGLQRLEHLDLGSTVTHSGGLPGFGSNMRWLPDRDFGVVALANRTYAPMAVLTLEVLELLSRADALPARHPTPTAAVAQAANALAALFSNWTTAAAADLFADNVLPDLAETERAAAAAKLVAATGPVTVASADAMSATEADAVLVGEAGEIHVSFQLSPQRPLRVQWYEATLHLPPRPALTKLSAQLAAAIGADLAGVALADGADRVEIERRLSRANALVGPCMAGDAGAHDGGDRATFRWHGERGDLDATVAVDAEDRLVDLVLRPVPLA